MSIRRNAHWEDRSLRYSSDWLRSPIRHRIADWLSQQLGHRGATGVVADIGAGTGQNAAILASRHGADVIQLDGTLAMLQRSVAGPARCQAECGALPLRSGSVGVVVLSLLLHHLSDHDQERAVGEARRILSDDGLLLITDQVRPRCTDGDEYGDLVRRSFYGHLPAIDAAGRFDIREENSRHPEELGTMLERHGFTLTSQAMLAPVVWAASAIVGSPCP